MNFSSPLHKFCWLPTFLLTLLLSFPKCSRITTYIVAFCQHCVILSRLKPFPSLRRVASMPSLQMDKDERRRTMGLGGLQLVSHRTDPRIPYTMCVVYSKSFAIAGHNPDITLVKKNKGTRFQVVQIPL